MNYSSMDPSWGLYIGHSKAKGSPDYTIVTYTEKNATNAFCCCWAAVCALCQDREKSLNAMNTTKWRISSGLS